MNIRDALLQFVNSELNEGNTVETIDVDTDLIENGIIDSIGIMKLMSFLEENLNIEIDQDLLVQENFENIQSISLMIDQLTKPN
jgi:acyl carrier protein